MNDVKRTLNNLAVLYLLLTVNILPTGDIIPPVFPVLNLSSIYLLFLSAWLFLRYYLRVAETARLKPAMLHMAAMIFLLVLFRCIKYSVFGSTFALGRVIWYLYYVPMLLIPQFLFEVSCYVYEKDEQQQRKRPDLTAAVTSALILLVLTNDLHQQVFCFLPGFADWDSHYSYAWGYIAATVWQVMLYLAAVAILLAKSSIVGIRSRAWLILLPSAIGVMMMLLLASGNMPKLNGTNVIQLPEALCSMAVGVLECCIQLGLIPTNENYRGLMQITSVPVQITDRNGRVIYKSGMAKVLTEEQFAAPDYARIGGHTVLRRMELPGGFGFWQLDVTELDQLNEELADAKEQLSEETELIRLQNELEEKQARIKQRSIVYDDIASSVQKQSLSITRIAEQAMNTADMGQREQACRHIALLGAYIKRTANLRLLSSQDGIVSAGDLGLSVAEVLRYLNLAGIPCEFIQTAVGKIPAEKAFAVFEAFDFLIEDHFSELRGVYVNFSTRKNSQVFKLTLENLRTDSSLPIRDRLAGAGVQTSFEIEEHVGYYSFVFEKGDCGL